MKQINIKPDETILFEKYFSQCDVTKTGRISPTEANKFFLKSGLPIEDLYKINEYCGANRLGYFGRSQFYIALKAIASAQSGECVDEKIITHSTDMIVPRFDHEPSSEVVNTISQKSAVELWNIPPPPNKYHMRTLSGNNILHSLHQRSVMNRYAYRTTQSRDSLKLPPYKFNVKHNSFDQTYLTHTSFFESDDDENNDECYEEEENKGLLNPNIKTDFDHLYGLNGDDVDLSSSSDQESSSVTGGSEENDGLENPDCGSSHDATGYMLMEAVEGLAVIPSDIDDTKVIPMATGEQLEYYTKCFQTMQSSEIGIVNGADVIAFFQLYNLQEEHIQKILSITNISPESEVTVVDFSRALHLITHQKTGFSIPDKVPDSLLPVDFHQPDEPFSFDLSTGDVLPGEMLVANQVSSLDSSFSGDGDSPAFDAQDVVVNRGWSQRRPLPSRSLDVPPGGAVPRSRPRPSARRSLTMAPCTPTAVAPPPPPRSFAAADPAVKRFSVDVLMALRDHSMSSSSSSSSATQGDHDGEGASSPRGTSVPDQDSVPGRRTGGSSEARRQLLSTIRECKSRNHVLLRLNNEMTSELEELREQRVNLHLQLEYVLQSQTDCS